MEFRMIRTIDKQLYDRYKHQVMELGLAVQTYDGDRLIRDDSCQSDREIADRLGLTAEEVFDVKRQGYIPRQYYEKNQELKQVIDGIASGEFSSGDTDLFRPIVDSLLFHDDYLLLADYEAYVDCCERAADTFRDPDKWTRMSILNTARCGFFSSDRSMRQYCDEIWQVEPLQVE